MILGKKKTEQILQIVLLSQTPTLCHRELELTQILNKEKKENRVLRVLHL